MAGESSKALRAEIQELRLRLEEAQQALEAIRTGQVDSLVVEGPDGPCIFSLESTSHSYRALVESMSEGAATLSEDGAILYCNGHFARMLGAPLEQVMGSSLHAWTPESLRTILKVLLEQAREGEAHGEMHMRAENGQEVPAHLSVSPLREEGRRVLCLVATDLRDQKQNEKVLAEGLLARSVLEQAADAVVVCDNKGRITRLSRSAEQLCGCNPLRAQFDAAFPVVLASPLLGGDLISNALQGAIFRAEPATLTRVDGSQAELLVSASPLQSADGKSIGCVATMVDVSESRRSDEVLRASEARFRSVLEDSRDVIYRINVQSGRYEYISPSAALVTGFSADELMVMDVETSQGMIHPDDAPAMQVAVASLVDTGKADIEYRQRTKDGDYRWLSNHMSLVKDSSGRPLYRNGNIRDVTERKQAEAAMQASVRLHRAAGESID